MPAACRIGDTDITHCSTPARAAGSSKVFVNGIPWSRQGDTNTPHLIPNDDPCSVLCLFRKKVLEELVIVFQVVLR